MLKTFLSISLLSFLLFCSFGLRVSALSVPNTYFSSSDASSLKTFLLSQVQESTLVKDLFYSSRALSFLKTPVPSSSGLCDRIVLKGKSTLENIYYYVGANELAGCNKPLSADILTPVRNALKEETVSLRDIYYAVSSLPYLKLSEKPELSHLVSKITHFMEQDGTFKATEKGRGSIYNAGLAFLSLSSIAEKGGLSQAQQELIQKVLEKLESVFSLASEHEDTLFFEDDREKTIKVTGIVLTGANQLYKVFPSANVDVTKDQLARIAEYFVLNRFPRTAEDAYFLLASLDVLAHSNRLPNPLVLSVAQGSVSTDNKADLIKVRVTDILGNFADKCEVTLVRAFSVRDPTTVLLKDKQGVPVDGSNEVYSFDLLSITPEPGSYVFEISVKPTQKKNFIPLVPAIRKVKVVTKITIRDVKVNVVNTKDNSVARTFSVQYPNTIEALSLNNDQKISVSFSFENQATGNDYQPVQAFVKLSSSDKEVDFVTKKSSYELTVSDAALKLDQSGTYKLSIVVGDPFISNSFLWNVADVKAEFSSSASGIATSIYKLIPEIIHQFREPEKRPPLVISNAFTLIVLSPLLLLIVGFFVVGNVRNIPTGIHFLFAIGFQASIGAILALFIVYWFQLTMFQTLGYLALLTIPTLLFGQRTLRYLSREIKKEKTQ